MKVYNINSQYTKDFAMPHTKQIYLSVLCLFTSIPFNFIHASQQRQNKKTTPNVTHKKHVVKKISDDEDEEESFELSTADKGAIAIVLLLAGYGIYAYRDELGNLVFKKKAPPTSPPDISQENTQKPEALSLEDMQAVVQKKFPWLELKKLEYKDAGAVYAAQKAEEKGNNTPLWRTIQFRPTDWAQSEMKDAWISMAYEPEKSMGADKKKSDTPAPASFVFVPNEVSSSQPIEIKLVQSIITQQNATLESTHSLIESYASKPHEHKQETSPSSNATGSLDETACRQIITERIPKLKPYNLTCEDISNLETCFRTIRFHPTSWEGTAMRHFWINLTYLDSLTTEENTILTFENTSQTITSSTLPNADLVLLIIQQKDLMYAEILQLIKNYVPKNQKVDAQRGLKIVSNALDNKFSLVALNVDHKNSAHEKYFCFRLATAQQASDWSFGLTHENKVCLTALTSSTVPHALPPTIFSRLVQTLAKNQESYSPLNYTIVQALAYAEETNTKKELEKTKISWLMEEDKIDDKQNGLSLTSFEHVINKTISSKDIKPFTPIFYLYALCYLEDLPKTLAQNSNLGTVKNNLETFPRIVRSRMNGWSAYYASSATKDEQKMQDISSKIHLAFLSAFLKTTSIHKDLLDKNTKSIVGLVYKLPHHTEQRLLSIDAKGQIFRNKDGKILSSLSVIGQNVTLFGVNDVQLLTSK